VSLLEDLHLVRAPHGVGWPPVSGHAVMFLLMLR